MVISEDPWLSYLLSNGWQRNCHDWFSRPGFKHLTFGIRYDRSRRQPEERCLADMTALHFMYNYNANLCFISEEINLNIALLQNISCHKAMVLRTLSTPTRTTSKALECDLIFHSNRFTLIWIFLRKLKFPKIQIDASICAIQHRIKTIIHHL